MDVVLIYLRFTAKKQLQLRPQKTKKIDLMKLHPFLSVLRIARERLLWVRCSCGADWTGRKLGLCPQLPTELNGVQVRGTGKKRDLPHFHASLSILILLHDLEANSILFLDTFGHIPTIFTYISLALSIYDSRSLGLTLLSSCIQD